VGTEDATHRRPEVGPTFAEFNAYVAVDGKKPEERKVDVEEHTVLRPATLLVLPVRGTIFADTVMELEGSQPKAGPVPREGRL